MLEAARNVACTGAEPIGLTDCLNFGNPEKGEIAWELVESIEGMAEACEALRIPIVSGNVSLYNETDGRAIDPTPVVGCVGLLEDVRTRARRAGARGTSILLAGASPVALAGLRVPGAVRRGRRPAGAARSRRPRRRSSSSSGAPRRTARSSTTSRYGGLAVALAEGRDPLRARRRGDAAGRSARLVRRRRRPGGARLRARASSTGSAASRSAGSASSAATACSGSRVDELREAARLMCGVFGIRSAERDVARLSLLRPLRAPASRPGGGRDRRLRPRPADRAPRHGPRRAGLRRGEAAGAPGRGRDRAHPLLDDRLERLGERAAARPPRPRPHGRARPQRQPDEHDASSATRSPPTGSCSARPRTPRRSRR